MTVNGVGERSGPRKVVQWRTSRPRARERQAGEVPGGVARDGGEAPGAAERELLHLDLVAPRQRAEQAVHVPRRPGAGLAQRRDIDADLHAAASS